MNKNEKVNADRSKLRQLRSLMARQSDGHIVAKQLIDLIIDRGTEKIYDTYVFAKLPSFLSDYGLRQAHEVFINAIMPHDENEPAGPHRSAIEEEPPVLAHFLKRFATPLLGEFGTRFSDGRVSKDLSSKQ